MLVKKIRSQLCESEDKATFKPNVVNCSKNFNKIKLDFFDCRKSALFSKLLLTKEYFSFNKALYYSKFVLIIFNNLSLLTGFER